MPNFFMYVFQDLVYAYGWPSRIFRVHRRGLDGRPRKNLAFLTSESGSPKKWCAIAHENRQNVGYARFGARLTFKMGWTVREGQPDAVFTDVHKKILHF